MASEPTRPQPFRITLREMFVLVTIFAVGLAALKFAGVWAGILTMIALLFLTGMFIIALVDRGVRQAFAIGFVVAATLYFSSLVFSVATQGYRGALDPYECMLPTSKIMLPVFQGFTTNTWIESSTGKILVDYDPTIPRPAGMGQVGLSEFPDRNTFMLMVHILWTLLFGYLGGHFARFVYARRDAPK